MSPPNYIDDFLRKDIHSGDGHNWQGHEQKAFSLAGVQMPICALPGRFPGQTTIMGVDGGNHSLWINKNGYAPCIILENPMGLSQLEGGYGSRWERNFDDTGTLPIIADGSVGQSIVDRYNSRYTLATSSDGLNLDIFLDQGIEDQPVFGRYVINQFQHEMTGGWDGYYYSALGPELSAGIDADNQTLDHIVEGYIYLARDGANSWSVITVADFVERAFGVIYNRTGPDEVLVKRSLLFYARVNGSALGNLSNTNLPLSDIAIYNTQGAPLVYTYYLNINGSEKVLGIGTLSSDGYSITYAPDHFAMLFADIFDGGNLILYCYIKNNNKIFYCMASADNDFEPIELELDYPDSFIVTLDDGTTKTIESRHRMAYTRI
jgi:hypothetical protein